jgi:hypothetical protein
VRVAGFQVDPGCAELGELFVRLAGRHGRGAHWRFFIGGTLAASPNAVAGLAASPVPATDAEYAALANRYGVDGWLLRRIVEAAKRPITY